MLLKRSFISSVIALSLLLSACGGQNAGGGNNTGITPPNLSAPKADQVDVKNAIVAVSTGVNSVIAEVQKGVSPQAIAPFASSLLQNLVATQAALTGNAPALAKPMGQVGSQQTNGKLPRGVYTCNSSYFTISCTKRGESDDLVYTYTTSAGKVVKVTQDWDSSSLGTPSATVTVYYPYYGGGLNEGYEAPTKLTQSVEVDGKKLAQYTLEQKYKLSRCDKTKYLGTPVESTTLSGFIAREDGSKVLEGEANLTMNDTEYKTAGNVKASSKTDAFSARWEGSLKGTTTYDDSTGCTEFGQFSPSSGSAMVNLSGSKQDFKTNIKADQFIYGTNSYGTYLNGVKGSAVIEVNGKLVTAEGILRDQDNDGVPGDEVTLTFANGPTTLEQFLIDNFGMQPRQ